MPAKVSASDVLDKLNVKSRAARQQEARDKRTQLIVGIIVTTLLVAAMLIYRLFIRKTDSDDWTDLTRDAEKNIASNGSEETEKSDAGVTGALTGQTPQTDVP